MMEEIPGDSRQLLLCSLLTMMMMLLLLLLQDFVCMRSKNLCPVFVLEHKFRKPEPDSWRYKSVRFCLISCNKTQRSPLFSSELEDEIRSNDSSDDCISFFYRTSHRRCSQDHKRLENLEWGESRHDDPLLSPFFVTDCDWNFFFSWTTLSLARVCLVIHPPSFSCSFSFPPSLSRHGSWRRRMMHLVSYVRKEKENTKRDWRVSQKMKKITQWKPLLPVLVFWTGGETSSLPFFSLFFFLIFFFVNHRLIFIKRHHHAMIFVFWTHDFAFCRIRLSHHHFSSQPFSSCVIFMSASSFFLMFRESCLFLCPQGLSSLLWFLRTPWLWLRSLVPFFVVQLLKCIQPFTISLVVFHNTSAPPESYDFVRR